MMHAARVRLPFLLAVLAFTGAQRPADAQTPVAQATHVLNRLTFGPRPGEAERVAAFGIERWIDAQLHPESIEDKAGAKALDGCQLWTLPLEEARALITGQSGFVLTKRDKARNTTPSDNTQLIACRLARMEASDQQLLEVMTNFWENHFSVYGRTMISRWAVVEWDRKVLRPHALGKFRDLLGAVAHSPTMLRYLDNEMNHADPDQPVLSKTPRPEPPGLPKGLPRKTPTGLNENYARELLELHTLGVDGGYTQADVIEVARAFTGWTHSWSGTGNLVIFVRARGMSPMSPTSVSSPSDVAFVFDSTWHDAAEKTVLGHKLQAGRGLEDGEQVLDIIARHPSTARFIARKLAVRFVSDSPPDALVERAAQEFLRTDGDIRAVVRTIVTSPEFSAPEAHGAKIKAPLELVLSTRRALAAPIDSDGENVDLLITLGQTPFGYLAPDGWPEIGADWMNAGAVWKRINFATSVSRDDLPSIPLSAWPQWSTLSAQPFVQQVDGVIRTLLQGRATPALREALLASKPDESAGDSPEARALALRRLVALALGSPEFQRR